LRYKAFEFLLNLVLGASWVAAVLGGAWVFFLTYTFSGFFTALAASFLGSLPGFLFVVLLESVVLMLESRKEQQRQGALLEAIGERLDRAGIPPVDDARLSD